MLAGIVEIAVDGNLIPANPTTKMAKAMLKQLQSEPLYLTIAEVDLLLELAEVEELAPPAGVPVFTGAGEMAAVQVRDLAAHRGR